ncbi:ECF-type sigma factor [Fimbriiglobus ruber]|uniref:RNA polymerase sigma-70 ECF-like HTH domain-containing protein n=1 Tax=Fimbriiglobus ruber TaxID=1908690 RepID=A0A225DDW8_9BACT|nr:ECF-type sigma factor [Fimbriiglobus ruber]OWK35339.1 hypothetical protein FRUB_09500 [Fimbriiglobus ruber]
MDEAPPGGSVTMLLAQVKARDPAVAQALWDRYFARLVALARARLAAAPRATGYEEDVALSAFHCFWEAASAGRFPRLDDRDDLWQVLLVITTRKAVGRVRHETRVKRGGKRGPGPSAAPETGPGPDAAVATGPSPEEVAEVTEACGRLLGRLGDGDLRSVAVWKMEGYTNAEIADRLGRSVPTVERKLATIRVIWEREGGE